MSELELLRDFATAHRQLTDLVIACRKAAKVRHVKLGVVTTPDFRLSNALTH